MLDIKQIRHIIISMDVIKMKHVGREIRKLDNNISRRVVNLPTIIELNEITSNNSYILKFLLENKDLNIYQKDIEKRFGITRSTTSKVLSLMEKKNLIIRKICENDSRVKIIKITDKGEELSLLIDEEFENLERQLLNGFTEKEKDKLFNFLERINYNCEEGNND